ncbi:MAG: YhbY family RNA-binding protein [Candidatus Bathyarchaeia archaeon]
MTKPKILIWTPSEEPTVWIGKKGFAASLINEVSKQLDKRETVKVRVLRTALMNENAKEIAQKIAEETRSEIVAIRGHTFIIHKSKKN